ncbi:MAG: efflux RND transporter periplasmic adaptor subunit [Candidatus Thiodiazotropha sp. (ex Notomyrtea botanica)]|nr:efflux RND transporter periplasmic adaptor subunit [Candidatus Thiodiazotropha sp. (ex Notomyrtea botanica)]
MTSTTRRLILTLGILFATMLIVVLLLATRPEAKTEMKSPTITRVEVTQVMQEDIQPRVMLTGILRPRQLASLRFEVSGELMQRKVEPGQAVNSGDLLLQLDNADYQDTVVESESQLTETRAAIQQDQALLKLARDNRDLAEREYQRLEKLGKGSLASVSTREGSRQQLNSLESELARLAFSVQSNRARLARQEAALSRARRNLERTRLLAPFEGRVNKVLAEVGDYLQGNSLAIELIDTASLELRLEVTGDVAGALTLGQLIEVDVEGQKVPGELVAMQFDPDPQTHTHPVSIRISGKGLLPGQLGRVGLPLRIREDALVVPASALLREAGGQYLFLVRDGRLLRQSVIAGIREGDRQIVRQGVEAGDLVVDRDVEVLSDGLEVKIENSEKTR